MSKAATRIIPDAAKQACIAWLGGESTGSGLLQKVRKLGVARPRREDLRCLHDAAQLGGLLKTIFRCFTFAGEDYGQKKTVFGRA